MDERLLVIDTCGEGSAVGLSRGEAMVGVRELSQRSASAEMVGAVRELLAEAGWTLKDLSAVGVVNGPGSFTGMRAGLAAAKGFCEAAGLKLAAVSRLEVLAGSDAGALAVLDAGRGQFYVRDQRNGREWLCGLDELEHSAVGRQVMVTEEKVRAALGGEAFLRRMHLEDAVPLMLLKLRAGAEDAALVEANYVREEQDIYPKGTPPAAPKGSS
jgi:tRNA threonylcarbamoyladenosine biosynthesis protein TsaB